jgi:hypothetical protein
MFVIVDYNHLLRYFHDHDYEDGLIGLTCVRVKEIPIILNLDLARRVGLDLTVSSEKDQDPSSVRFRIFAAFESFDTGFCLLQRTRMECGFPVIHRKAKWKEIAASHMAPDWEK